MLDEIIKQRFFAKIQKTDSCWLWTGTITGGGYGHFRTNKGPRGAHRVSFELKNGSIPKGLDVLHHCDIRNCVNPDHLWLGTHKDNMRDMESKNRGNHAKGEKQGLSKLNPTAIRDIRLNYKPRLVSLAHFARKYCVSRYAIRCVIARKTWKHI